VPAGAESVLLPRPADLPICPGRRRWV